MAFNIIRQTEDGVPVYECLSTDTKETPKPLGAEAYETDTGDKYEYLGSTAGWVQTHGSGHALTSSMPAGPTHIREDLLMSTSAVTFDFSTTPIIAATIYLVPIATVTNEYISAAVCIDPPSSAVRDAWLTGADALTTDSQRIPVTMQTPPIELVFTSAVDYIGGKIDIGTTAECRMIIVGVEA